MNKPLRILYASGLAVALTLLASAPARAEGPIPIRNLYPLYYGIPMLQPRSAVLKPGWEVSSAYSLVVTDEQSDHWSALMDMETAYIQPRYTWRLNEETTVSASIPIYYASGGFMDGFVEDYHQFLGFPQGERPRRPHNKFGFRITHNGKVVLQSAGPGPAFGDLDLTVNKQIVKGRRDRLMAEFLADLPIGSQGKGYGNGSTDFGAILHFNHRTRKFGWYSSVAYFMPGEFGNVERIDLNNYSAYSIAGEWFKTPHTSFVVQFSGFSNPFPPTGLDDIDEHPAEFAMVLRRQLKSREWSLGFTENLTSGQSPDINFIAIINWRGS